MHRRRVGDGGTRALPTPARNLATCRRTTLRHLKRSSLLPIVTFGLRFFAFGALRVAFARPSDPRRPLRATIARDGVSSRMRATSRHGWRTTLRLRKLSSALPILSFGLRIVALQALHAAFHLRTDARRTRSVTCRTRTATCRTRTATCRTRNVSRRLRRVARGARNATLRTLLGALQERIVTMGARRASRTSLLVARRVRRDALTTPHVALQRRRVTLREVHATSTRANASVRRPNASLRRPNVTLRRANVARRRRRVSLAARRDAFPSENASLRTPDVASSARLPARVNRAFTRRGCRTTSRGPSWADR